MRQTIYCPFCGEKIELEDERINETTRNTTKLEARDLHELLAKTHRSDRPPPIHVPRDPFLDVGWIRREMREKKEREKRQRRVLISGTVIILLAILACFMRK